MSCFICNVCGHVEFGSAPERCPVCFAPQTSFVQNDNVFAESEEKSREGAVKHIPSIKINHECKIIPEESCVDAIVRIGETLHPMTEEHSIQFIDCYVDDVYVTRVFLTPGVFPSAVIHLKQGGSTVRIVQNCNLHGHWQAEAGLSLQ
jgi:desulfoferrodoxin-like iron-binding protein